MKYLVQIQVKKASGKVHLLSTITQAGSPEQALDKVRDMSAGSGEIIGAYVTGDQYKILRIGSAVPS